MPQSRPITKEELKAIKQSVLDARSSLKFWRNGLRRFPKSESNFAEIVLDERTLLLAYRFDVGRESYPLDSSTVREIVQHALDAGNTNFFIKFGQLLARPPLGFGRSGRENRLEKFLLDHWAEKKDDLPELFYLTPESLAAVCVHFLKPDSVSDDDYTADALVKLRQRLGLKPFRRQKIKVIRVGTRLRFLKVDNKQVRAPVHDQLLAT